MMIEWLCFKKQMYSFERWDRRVKAGYAADLTKALSEKKSHDDLRNISHSEYEELALNDELRRQVVTKYLVSKAHRLIIPVPDYNDDLKWEEGHRSGGKYLTSLGVKELRSDIRKERVERFQSLQAFLFWIPMLIGLIGAIAGLVAILHK